MGKKIKIKVVTRVDEVSSEKQRKFMCAMTSDDADRPDGLSKSEAEEMCKDTGHSQNEGAEEETQPEYQYTIPKQNPQRRDNSNGSKEFIEKYNSLTSPAQSSSHFQIGDVLRSTGVEGTFDSDYRVWKFPLNCEVLTSIKVNDNHIYLSLIFVSPNCEKRGFASTVMGELIRLANVTETMIGLHSAYSQDDVTYGDKLFDWYKKFGFGYDEKWFNEEMYDLVYSPKKNPSRKQQTPPQSAIEISKSQNEGVEEETQPDTNNVSKVVAVTMDNKVLILKRTDTGEFDIPGGHGKEGETAEDTAERETKEETELQLSDLKEISTKQVTFQGREETITYLYAKLNSTSEVLASEIDLDTNENTKFYFVDPQSIDDYMGNATQNLKNVGNNIKSLTMEEQMEPFQRKVAAGYSKKKKKMIGQGGNKYISPPYSKKPSYKRSKSAPPGFGGALEESMTNLLAEIEFDLSKLQLKEQLCPSVWQNNNIKPDIRQKLLQIAQDFIDGSPIEGRVEDITFTGSLAGYNYHDGSDIDLHLLVDFGEDDELVQKLMNLMRINWNENHDIHIAGHEVEIYVQDANEKHYSAGVYSLSDGKWLVEPSKEAVELDYDAIVDKAQGLSDEIDAIEDDYNAKRYEKVQKSVERLREKMKKMRSDGLEDEGIYSVENLAFKLLRNSGQIAKLMNLGNDSYDSEFSDSKKGKIRVNIVQNVDEKKKKRRKKRKKAKKRRYHGVYYPYGGLQDTFSGDSGDGGDGGGGGE